MPINTTILDSALKALDANSVVELLSEGIHRDSSIDDEDKDDDYLDITEELTASYVRVVHANPTFATDITEFIVSLVKSGRVPKVPFFYEDRNPPETVEEDFERFFQQEVFEKIRRLLDDDGNSALTPKNPYLTGALVSAACMAAGFVHCSDQIAAIKDGLQLDGKSDRVGRSGREEIHAALACLHVLMAGTVAFPFTSSSRFPTSTEVAKKLKSLTVLKDKGKPLLEAAILHAEAGFPANLSSAEAWGKLFPPE